MIYPVKYIGITQGHHVGKHIDFGWHKEHNCEIYSVDNGYVMKIENQEKGGKVVYIKHYTGLISQYAHLDSYKVVKGQKVIKGEVIGRMGATGSGATGEHLDFAIYKENENIHGYSSLSPLDFLVANERNEISEKTKKEYKILYGNDEEIKTGTWRLLVSKAIRRTPELTDNIVRVGECMESVKKKLTNKGNNDKAFFKVGSNVDITELYTDETGRMWGKMKNCWIVLRNKDLTFQSFFVDTFS